MADTLKLTKAQRRTLEIVKAGGCWRRYHERGNAMRGPAGVSATVLWKLAMAGLIEDGVGYGNEYRLILTKRGAAALSPAGEKG